MLSPSSPRPSSTRSAASPEYPMDQTGDGGRRPGERPSPGESAAMARDYVASLPPDHFAFDDPDRRFGLLLDLFVDGPAQRAEREAA